MRPFYTLVALLILAMLPMTGECFSTKKGAEMHQAESLLSEYFSMLEIGNIPGILDLLTGPMLKTNENVLRNNPGYAAFLRDRYRHSSFIITKYELIEASRAMVDVVIILNTQEEIRTRFILAVEGGNLRIYAEEEIITPERNTAQ